MNTWYNIWVYHIYISIILFQDNEETFGTPHLTVNLDRESTGTYDEIGPPQSEYDYVGHATGVMYSNFPNSASNLYQIPIVKLQSYHSYQNEIIQQSGSADYENLRQSRQAEPHNLHLTTNKTSYITPVDNMTCTGNGAEGGYLDLALILRDTQEDGYLKPRPLYKNI